MIKLVLGAGCLAVLAACSGGGNIDIGSGQSPDPATIDFPIAYVKRTLPDLTQDDVHSQRLFQVDADLFVRDRADPSTPERNVTERITGTTDMWDVRDVDVAFDGTSIVFAMRGPMIPNGQEEDQPTWNIWQYTFATDTLKRIITSDLIAEEGHDRSPHFLPDGRIVFTSTRQRQARAVLLDEGKPQFEIQTEDRSEPVFLLHVMNADGTGIKQISFGTSHDIDPMVTRDGRVVWSRWDTAPGRNGIHLYSANPDGTDEQLLYGKESHATGTNNSDIEFIQPHELPDGRIMALIRPDTDAEFGGDLTIIDTATYVENTQATLANQGMTGPAQSVATGNDVRTVPGISPGGRFSSFFPLWDGSGRIAVSWTQCRAQLNGEIRPCTNDVVNDPAALPAEPQYSIWMYDTVARAFLPLMTPETGMMITDVAIAQPRSLPAVILDKVPGLDVDQDLVSEGVGIVDIRSVYDIDGTDSAPAGIATLANPANTTADERPARFIRFVKPVFIPDRDVLDIDNAAFGASNFMAEILAYAMVEPDGSVRSKVPANVPFMMEILNRDGMRISPPHGNWLQLRPGEVLSCNGCHVRDPQNPQSHGRRNLFAQAWVGAPGNGPFPNTVPTVNAQSGDTMAQAMARYTCGLGGLDKCKSMHPAVDMLFEDVWTDAATAGRAPDAAFSVRHADLSTPSPTRPDCMSRWSATCRLVINYETIVHPLWSLPRVTLDAGGAVIADNTCTSCHSPRDAANAVRVPAGQLDLTDGPSDEEPLQFRAYRELLFTDNAQEVNMGALQDILVQTGTDPVTGQPVLSPVPVAPSMRARNALGSTAFFGRFAAGGSHAGYLTAAELQLLAEWLDIGAQYFNNPFVAPVN